MKPEVAIMNIILDRAVLNVQGCINNKTDATRATHVGEKAWHIHKYTDPLKTDKLNLEEDLQLLSNVASSSKVKVFGSEADYQKLDNIVTAWSHLGEDEKITPLKTIKKTLMEIKKRLNK